MKSFCGGPGDTYSAVLRNAHGDDTSFEAPDAVLALQMPPHAVGFSRKEPPGLLFRAECYRFMKHDANARDDLKEAEEIAEMGGMKLFICDYHLEAARLCAAEGKDKDAQRHFQAAKEMIEKTGYLRRKNELERK